MAEFTEQEWETMHRGVTGAGLLVSLSDRSFFDTFKEAGALATHLASGRESDSLVVRELAQRRGSGFGLTSSPDDVETGALDALRTSVGTLETKAPEEVEPYRAFVLEVARSVASAAGGGDSAESGALARIRAAVGATA